MAHGHVVAVHRTAPGALFSASGKYRHCMRLNYASPPAEATAAAIHAVGEAATAMVADAEPLGGEQAVS